MPHGGYRKGAGRLPELDDPQKVLVTLEGRHLKFLEYYQREHELNRSAALRKILDRYVKRRS
jgi:hypothetical protein